MWSVLKKYLTILTHFIKTKLDSRLPNSGNYCRQLCCRATSSPRSFGSARRFYAVARVVLIQAGHSSWRTLASNNARKKNVGAKKITVFPDSSTTASNWGSRLSCHASRDNLRSLFLEIKIFFSVFFCGDRWQRSGSISR